MYRSVSEDFYLSGGVPHEEVDWASLAKQWIAMQQHTQIVPSMSASIPPPLHAIDKPPAMDLIEMNAGVIYRQPIANVAWTGVRHVLPPQLTVPQVNVPQRMPTQNVGPPPPTTTPFMLPVRETAHMAHIRPPPVNQFNNVCVPMPPQAWNQSAPPVRNRPPFVPSNRDLHSNEATSTSRSNSCPPVTTENNIIDANKRKQLPAWIREGLERMEKEKQKKLEKEKEDEERREWLRLEKERQQEIDSHELTPETDSKLKHQKHSKHEDGNEKLSEEYDWTNDAESELYKEMMLKVRKIITELLLEVTDEEIKSAAKEVIDKAKNSRVSANKQLAVATPITKLTTLGGLISGYGSGSDSECDDENKEVEKCREKTSTSEKKVEDYTRQQSDDKKDTSNSRRTSSSSDYSKKTDSSSKSKPRSEDRFRRRKSDDDDKRKHRRSRSKSRSRSESHSTSSRHKHKRHRSRSRSKSKDRKRSKRSRSRSCSVSKSKSTRSRSRSRDRRRK